jgi:hypothetical protein
MADTDRKHIYISPSGGIIAYDKKPPVIRSASMRYLGWHPQLHLLSGGNFTVSGTKTYLENPKGIKTNVRVSPTPYRYNGPDPRNTNTGLSYTKAQLQDILDAMEDDDKFLVIPLNT